MVIEMDWLGSDLGSGLLMGLEVYCVCEKYLGGLRLG